MPKPLQPQLNADSDSDSSEDGDFVPSGSGRCCYPRILSPLHARPSTCTGTAASPTWLSRASDCICSGSDSDAADSDISDGEVKKVSADAGDAVKLVAAAGQRATRASGASVIACLSQPPTWLLTPACFQLLPLPKGLHRMHLPLLQLTTLQKNRASVMSHPRLLFQPLPHSPRRLTRYSQICLLTTPRCVPAGL